MKFQLPTFRFYRSYPLILLVTVFALALTTLSFTRAKGPVHHHLARLNYLREGPFLKPRSFREWFSLAGARFVHWNITQRICGEPTSYIYWGDELEKERQTLVALHYYDLAWIRLPHGCSLSDARLKNTAVARTRFTTHGDMRRPAEIRVTARPEEIREFAAAISAVPSR
jgi:hypothetical protein